MKTPVFAFGLVLASFLFLFGCPAVAVEKGDAIAVWQQKGATYDVWYSIWDHTEKKWYVPSGGATAPIATDAGDDHDADVSSNSGRTAIAAWSKVTGGSSTIYYSRWEKDAWSAPATLASGSSDTDPTVAMEPSGKALAVWVSGGNALLYSKFTPGSGWSAPDKITSMDKVSLPELAYGGKYYLVFTASSGSASSAYESSFDGSSWSAPVPVSSSAVLDNSVPTDQRTGIDAGNKGEATSVFPGTDGKVYSHVFGAAAANAFAGGAMPDTAYGAPGSAAGAYSSASDLYHQPNVNAPAAPSAISTLGGDDSRASLTFIRGRTIGLVVFWKPEGIYYSYNEAGTWAPPKPLGSSPGRNPAVTPLASRIIEGPYCGNNILEPPEQCEVAIACANPNDICMPDCTCWREPPKNKTKCGDGKLQGAEQCEVGIACPVAGQICKIPPCECVIKSEPPRNETENKTTVSCAANTLTVNYAKDGSINVQASATLACKDDCKTLNPNWVCDPQGCFCKETRTVTPRCGDGYVSTPNTPGGGFEECDVGFGFYQPKDANGRPITKPDTCPAPKVCDPPTCKCILPVTENITQYHSECDFAHGLCTQVEGAGQSECSSDSQCVKPPVCGNQVVETGEVCESNSDCVRQISGQTVTGTCKDSCKTCEYNLYCGDGIVFTEGGEQCENDNQCSQGNVCSGCLCTPPPTHKACQQGACVIVEGAGSSQCSVSSDCVPPVIDCPAYCSGAGYSQNLGGGYSSSQACYTAATSGQPAQCTTLCQFAKYYTESNQAGTTSCCCGHSVSLACTDCPGQNPVCPSQNECNAYDPG